MRLVPGMGTTGIPRCSPRVCTQVSASWAGATPLFSASARTTSAMTWLAVVRKRGSLLRASPGGRDVTSTVPARKPRLSGEYATSATPSSRRQSATAVSGSRDQIEYSLCTAAIE